MKRRFIVTLPAYLGLASVLHAAPGDVDLTFDAGSRVNGTVYSVATQADGKVIIGGSFTTVRGAARNRIARLNADGTVDDTFHPGKGAGAPGSGNPDVHSVAVQSDGKVLVGGYFTVINGTSRNGVARLNADGSLDEMFNPSTGPDDLVNAVAVQPDGKVLVGGILFTINGTSRYYMTRLNTDGSLDSTFNPGTKAVSGVGGVSGVAMQPDGKMLVAGYFTTIDGTSGNRIGRLNADGSLDIAFNPRSGADDAVLSVAVQPDGKVLAGGLFTTINGTNRNSIARLNADGSLDGTFDPAIEAKRFSGVHAVALQTGGNWMAANCRWKSRAGGGVASTGFVN